MPCGKKRHGGKKRGKGSRNKGKKKGY